MKLLVATVLAVVLGAAAYLVYEVGALRDGQGELQERLTAAAATTEAAARDAGDRNGAKIEELSLRVAMLEEAARSRLNSDAGPDATAASKLEATVAAHAEELAAIRKDLEGMQRTRGAIDRTADRLLEVVGQDAAPAEGRPQGGLERLMEMGELMRKRPEDLTPEEKARRDEIAAQLRARQTDWAVRGFERSLTVKLTDEQRAGVQQMLQDEGAALSGIADGLSDEERAASQKAVRDQTDQRAATLLSTEQYESWKTYRSRPGRGGRILGGRE